jgi:hypothetical protein
VTSQYDALDRGGPPAEELGGHLPQPRLVPPGQNDHGGAAGPPGPGEWTDRCRRSPRSPPPSGAYPCRRSSTPSPVVDAPGATDRRRRRPGAEPGRTRACRRDPPAVARPATRGSSRVHGVQKLGSPAGRPWPGRHGHRPRPPGRRGRRAEDPAEAAPAGRSMASVQPGMGNDNGPGSPGPKRFKTRSRTTRPGRCSPARRSCPDGVGGGVGHHALVLQESPGDRRGGSSRRPRRGDGRSRRHGFQLAGAPARGLAVPSLVAGGHGERVQAVPAGGWRAWGGGHGGSKARGPGDGRSTGRSHTRA